MPADGDFQIRDFTVVTPDDMDIDVAIDLDSVTMTAHIVEWTNFGLGFDWWHGNSTLVTALHGAAINRSPSINMGSPTIEGGPVSSFILTSVFNQALVNGTLYTWSFSSIDVTHNSFPGPGGFHNGVPQRNTFDGAEFTFTTIFLPGSPKVINPFPSNAGSDISLLPTLTWEAG